MEDEIRKLEVITQPLDPNLSSRQDMQEQTLSYVNDFYKNLDVIPAFEPSDKSERDTVKNMKIGPAYKFDHLMDFIKSNVFNKGINSTKGDMSYVPLGGLYTSALADYMTSVFNKCPSHHFEAPGVVDMENHLIRWTADLFGYPIGALGNMTSGGSLANLIALTTARDAANILPEDIRKSVIYMTAQTHSSMIKAVHMAGMGKCVVRFVDVDAGYRMRPDALRERMEKDLEYGLKPFMVVGTCGTTDTGAVDPIDAMADVCQEHKVWLHVDAAYGGFFVLVDELKEKMKGMSRTDSITLDPHKTLFLPFGCSMILIRDGRKLFNTYHVKASYFLTDSCDTWDENSAVNPSDLSPEMSRPFRGLKMWLPLLLHGVEPFSACLKEKVMLTRYFYTEVQKLGFVVGPEPDLTICIHRFVPKFGDANLYNELLMKSVRMDGRVFVSSTMIDGVFWIRVAILQFRTHLATIKLYLSLLRAEVETSRQG